MKPSLPEPTSVDTNAPSPWPAPGWGFLEIVIVYLCVMGVVTAFESWGQGFYQWAAPLVAGDNYQLGHFYWAALLQYFSILLLIGLTVAWAGRGTWQDMGLRIPGMRPLLLYGGLGGILLLTAVVCFSYILLWINPMIESQPYAVMLQEVRNYWDFLYVLIIGAFVAPIAEETYFRGMIYPVMRHRYGVWGGIALCGLLFGASHLDLWRSIPLAAGGMILAYIYEKTGSVLPCVLAHAIWNGIMTVLMYWNLL